MKYKQELSSLKLLFENINEQDLLLLLEQTNGDLDSCIDKITQGNYTAFSVFLNTYYYRTSSVGGRQN